MVWFRTLTPRQLGRLLVLSVQVVTRELFALVSGSSIWITERLSLLWELAFARLLFCQHLFSSRDLRVSSVVRTPLPTERRQRFKCHNQMRLPARKRKRKLEP